MTKPKKEFYSLISAILHVSETEIAALYPDYDCSWFENDLDKLKGILYDLGLDTKQSFELQEATRHRNRMNQVVTCSRYYGNERTDHDWLTSGLASAAAKDKAKNSRMLDDCYRSRAMTIDTQMALEARDKYNVVEELEGDE